MINIVIIKAVKNTIKKSILFPYQQGIKEKYCNNTIISLHNSLSPQIEKNYNKL